MWRRSIEPPGPAQGNRAGSPARFENLANNTLAASVAGALLICAALLVYGSGRGFDLTDETFYLVWTSDPKAYSLIYQPFGYLLHPLYELVGRNLQAYRLCGFAITATAGAYLGSSLARVISKPRPFTLYGALAALTIYFPWIITPSYNSAANVGAMLVTGGLLDNMDCRLAKRLTGALAVACGLCVAAFSKPPLFAFALLGIVIAGIAVRRARVTLLSAVVVGVAAMWLFIPVWDLPRLVERIIATQEALSLPNTAAALPAKIVRDWIAVPLPLTAAAILVVLGLVRPLGRWRKLLGYAAIALSIYYVASIASDAIDGTIPDFLGLAVMTIAGAYASIAQHVEHRGRWPIALLFAAPVAVGLGTFNNEWFQLNFSMAFPFLAMFGIALNDVVTSRRRIAEAFAIFGVLAVMALAAWAPYSLPAPIFAQQVPINPPLAKGRIRVDDETADFVRSAQGNARGALLIDLSGTGPGVAAILGARPPVLPWLNPATASWPDVVWSRLGPEERQQAWFVLPVWPNFAHSQPVQWLKAHKDRFCRAYLAPMTFWAEERRLELWWPCTNRNGRSAVQDR